MSEAFKKPPHVECENEDCLKPHNECGHAFFDPCGCHACTWEAAEAHMQEKLPNCGHPTPGWKPEQMLVAQEGGIYKLREKQPSPYGEGYERWSADKWVDGKWAGTIALFLHPSKVEPYPRVGDWVTCQGAVFQVVTKGDVTVTDEHGLAWPLEDLEPASPPVEQPSSCPECGAPTPVHSTFCSLNPKTKPTPFDSAQGTLEGPHWECVHYTECDDREIGDAVKCLRDLKRLCRQHEDRITELEGKR